MEEEDRWEGGVAEGESEGEGEGEGESAGKGKGLGKGESEGERHYMTVYFLLIHLTQNPVDH